MIENVDIDIDKDPSNIYKILWDKFERTDELPKYLNKVVEYNYDEVKYG